MTNIYLSEIAEIAWNKHFNFSFIAPDEIHNYFIDFELLIDEYLVLYNLLTEIEKVRAGKFLLKEDRYRYVYGHSFLRLLLSKYTFTLPIDLDIKETALKKPYLVNGTIHFNLSHSGKYVMLAFSKQELGVDIEFCKQIDNFKDIANNYFALNEIECIDKTNSLAAFYKYWTCKEAFLKAVGIGLNFELNKIDMSNQSNIIEIGEKFDNKNYYISSGQFFNKYHFAVASEKNCKIINCRVESMDIFK